MLTRRIGDRTMSGIGLGTASMALRGVALPTCTQVIHAALDAGIRLFDAAAAYTPDVASVGHSERLLAHAVSTWNGPREEVVIVTKGGHRRVRNTSTADAFIIDGRPEAIRNDLDNSLSALATDQADVYLLHWPDPEVPLTESFGTLVDLRNEGKAGAIGLSNVTVDQLNEAATAGRIDFVQNQFSVLERGSQSVLDWCEAHDVIFLAYSPLGGARHAGDLSQRLPAFTNVANSRAVSTQQVALSWLLHHSAKLLPIVGARRVQTVLDSANAAHLHLSHGEQHQLSTAT